MEIKREEHIAVTSNGVTLLYNVGEHVQITTVNKDVYTGKIIGMPNDVITIETLDSIVVIPIKSIQFLYGAEKVIVFDGDELRRGMYVRVKSVKFILYGVITSVKDDEGVPRIMLREYEDNCYRDTVVLVDDIKNISVRSDN